MRGEIKRMKAEKTREYLGGEISITRIRLIIFIVGIVVTVFMQTDVFESLDVALKIIIIGVMFGAGILFRVDLTASREIGLKIKDIYKDRKMTWFEKGLEFGNLGMDLLHKAGEMWQIGDAEQFPEKELEPIPEPDGVILNYDSDTTYNVKISEKEE